MNLDIKDNIAEFQRLNIGREPFKVFLKISPDGVVLIKTGWIQRKILSWLLGFEVALLQD